VPLPSGDHKDDAEIGDSIYEKCRTDAGNRNHHAAKRGSDGARKVKFNAIERGSRREVFLLNQLRQSSSPGRALKCISCRKSKREHEKQDRSGPSGYGRDAKYNRDSSHPNLGGQDQFPAVDNVTQSAGW
jgi:hypothetical protein